MPGKIKILPIIFLFLLSACGVKNKITVTPVNQINRYEPNALIYSLPATKILIVVEADKIVENVGPFLEYTDKYLGSLKDIVKKNNTFWQLSKVEFYTVPVVDTANIYVISSGSISPLSFISLSKEGFITGINTSGNVTETPAINFSNTGTRQNTPELSFAQISADKTYKEVYDTIFKKEVYDTIFKIVPIIRKNVIRKNREEQAKELAEEIFTLRDDRNALLVGEGDSEQLPDGPALQIMLKGLDKLEKQYLEMFIGRRDTIKYYYLFSFVPSENNFASEQKILFKFSEKKGVISAESLEGEPVILEITPSKATNKIKDFNFNQTLYKTTVKKRKIKNGLYYRIPEKAHIKLKKQNTTLGEKEAFIAQYGAVVSLPANLTENPNIKIEFYPELGAIKSITTK